MVGLFSLALAGLALGGGVRLYYIRFLPFVKIFTKYILESESTFLSRPGLFLVVRKVFSTDGCGGLLKRSSGLFIGTGRFGLIFQPVFDGGSRTFFSFASVILEISNLSHFSLR